MTDKEILEKLNVQLKEVQEMLALGDIELLKSEELHATKSRIEDELKELKPFFGQAINDAKTLLSTHGATSALDRIHTVLHGYLKQVCKDTGISYQEDATLNQLMNLLKEKHPALTTKNSNTEHVLKSTANILDKLNPLRNNSGLAHPNEVLLEPDEAMLVINAVNTLLAYLNSKFGK